MPFEIRQQEHENSEEANCANSTETMNANKDYGIVTKYLNKCGITSEISCDDIDPSSLSYLLERSQKKVAAESCDFITEAGKSTKEEQPSPDPIAETSNRTEFNKTDSIQFIILYICAFFHRKVTSNMAYVI